MNPQDTGPFQSGDNPGYKPAELSPSPDSTPSSVPASPVKIGKFKASWMIVKESWGLLKQDKELAWFPVLSSITSLIALIVMGTIFFFVVMAGDIHSLDNIEQTGVDALSYVILFVYYLVMFLITNYFLAGMFIIVHARFNGQNLSFSDGLNGASRNFGKIFVWSLISATVGVILRIIADRSRIIGKIVAVLLGAAWSIMTYFSLPSLVIGQTSIKGSFKESAAIIRKTWGEAIIVNFGVGLFFALMGFLGFALSVGIIVVAPVSEIMVLVAVLLVLYIIALSILSSTLAAIFKLALYEYAKTGKIPQGFTPALVLGAVKGGK